MSQIFEKSYVNHILFEEALDRSEEAYQISQRVRFLYAPRIISYDKKRLLIAFEYMEGWATIASLIRNYRYNGFPQGELVRIFRTVGCALAEYHSLGGKIHGDFDSTNVLFKRGEPRICLIDFSRPDFADYAGYCYGSIYRDLALFIINLRIKYPPHKLHLAYRAINQSLSKNFLMGYFEISEEDYSFDLLDTEFRTCLKIPYLAHSFVHLFFWWSNLFNIEDLRS